MCLGYSDFSLSAYEGNPDQQGLNTVPNARNAYGSQRKII